MGKKEFNNLGANAYFHDIKSGEEWQILRRNGDFWTCLCTKEGLDWELGKKTEWSEISAGRFTAGRHPDNLPKEAQELFVNVYQDLGKEIYIGLQCFKSTDEAYKVGISVYNYRYTAKLVPVEIEQPFVPKHGEKCRVETIDLKSYECTVVEIIGEFYAHCIFKDGNGSRIYYPYEIKQFLPL
jgi:hypothetical protein